MSGILDISGMLSTIYGTSSGTGPAISTDPLGDLRRAEADSDKDIVQTAAEPQVARDIATFRAAVAAATDPATLLRNPTVLKVLLTANGLGDQAQYPALAQKALLSDTTQPGALANQLPNASWKAAASTFAFATQGLSLLTAPGVLDTIASGYAEVLWRQSLDAATPGLSNALTFRAKASTIATVGQILGDSALRTVVTTALGIPLQIAFQDLGAQELSITSQLDITKFKDPKYVEKFTQLYLIQANIAAQNSASTGTNPVLAQYGFGGSGASGSSASNSDLLASLAVKGSGLLV